MTSYPLTTEIGFVHCFAIFKMVFTHRINKKSCHNNWFQWEIREVFFSDFQDAVNGWKLSDIIITDKLCIFYDFQGGDWMWSHSYLSKKWLMNSISMIFKMMFTAEGLSTQLTRVRLFASMGSQMPRNMWRIEEFLVAKRTWIKLLCLTILQLQQLVAYTVWFTYNKIQTPSNSKNMDRFEHTMQIQISCS